MTSKSHALKAIRVLGICISLLKFFIEMLCAAESCRFWNVLASSNEKIRDESVVEEQTDAMLQILGYFVGC